MALLCRDGVDSISTCDNSSHRLRGVVSGLECGTDGLGRGSHCAPPLCPGHILHRPAAHRLLQVPRPCLGQEELYLHGCCASKPG